MTYMSWLSIICLPCSPRKVVKIFLPSYCLIYLICQVLLGSMPMTVSSVLVGKPYQLTNNFNLIANTSIRLIDLFLKSLVLLPKLSLCFKILSQYDDILTLCGGQSFLSCQHLVSLLKTSDKNYEVCK